MKKQKEISPAILVIDIGGNNVKPALVTSIANICNVSKLTNLPSSRTLTPQKMVKHIQKVTKDLDYHGVVIGYPGVVKNGKIMKEPANLGKGWIKFDFNKAFKTDTYIMNDAAMQAKGSWAGTRTLFLGLGYGLGTALVDVDAHLVPLELGHLPFKDGKTFEKMVGTPALRKLGLKAWSKNVHEMIKTLAKGIQPETIVLGGGNSKQLKTLPKIPGITVRVGHNDDAFTGGYRQINKG